MILPFALSLLVALLLGVAWVTSDDRERSSYRADREHRRRIARNTPQMRDVSGNRRRT